MLNRRDIGDLLGIRVAAMLVPINATMHFGGLRLPKAMAWGLSIFMWLVIAYLIPPWPRTGFRSWIVIAASLSIVASLLAMFQPDMF